MVHTDETSPRLVRVFGHGADEPGNEINTLPSFDHVRAAGAYGVELDVRRTADDKLVVIHDAAVGDGRQVADLTFAEFEPHVPTLTEALDACHGLVVNIEIKNFPRDPAFDPEQRVTDLVVDLLKDRGFADDVLISCFDQVCLHHVRRRAKIETALLMFSRRAPAELLDLAIGGGNRIVHPYEDMVDEAFMIAARKRDLVVNVWTGPDDSRKRLTELVALGVDGIITPAVELALEVATIAR